MSNASMRDTATGNIIAVKDTAIVGGLLTILVLILAASSWNSKKANGTPTLRGPPVVGHWRFFSDRYAFINDGLKKLGSAFQFKVLNHTVVAVSGERARTDFLTSPALSFREGYKVLFGITPSVRHVKSNFDSFESSEASWFAKRVVSILRRDRLQRMIPRIFEDLRVGMKKWGSSGRFDPLDDIYDLVFQLTVRASSSTELADDPVAVKKLKQCLHDCEKAASPASLLVSWLPFKDRKQRQKSSKEMYQLFKKVLDERRSTGHREDDPTQVLIDEGSTDNDIVEFSMIALFAGVANTGIMAAWVLMYLATDAVWKAKVGNEVQKFIAKYAPDFESGLEDPIDNLATQLSKVPVTVWENEMELTDLCLRETIRMAQSSVFLRRNLSRDAVNIGGHSIGSGDFVAYPSADVHHNPAVYEAPATFDPTRHIAKGDEKTPPFVGWGAGRHPCLGMRFAKFEVFWIVTMFVAAYDYEVVNQKGVVIETLPEPNHNNIFDRTKRPEGEILHIKYYRKST